MRSDHNIRFAGIIPARYASTRFPGKPLAMIGNKTMIRRVYEQASKILDAVYVATDDDRIMNEVLSFGGRAVMTSAEHQSGTDRVAEAAGFIASLEKTPVDVVINIQGDEPFIRTEQIELLMNCFNDSEVKIATLIRKVGESEDIINPNQPKVIVNLKGDAIYFSRTPVPYIRGFEPEEWTKRHLYFKHIGIYAYRTDVLHKLTMLEQSSLETAESLEQNRWIENGYAIRTAVTPWESIGIDTPSDLQRAELLLDMIN